MFGATTALLISLVAFTSAAPTTGNGCFVLASTLPGQVAFPFTPKYLNESESVWSQTCLLTPTCVFTPKSAEDLATALTVITRTKTPFAVRSGGHMPVPGAQSTDEGVLIAMSNFRSMQLIQDNKVAQIGPGLRWGEVYDWISSSGLGVVGGRYGPVGVAGLLLGGGINYFGNRFGWSMSNVDNFQVVLVDGRIVNANAKENADLFWALKGGSLNFGIVTRFDIRTHTAKKIFGGFTTFDTPQTGQVLQAVDTFIQPNGGGYDPNTHINPCIFVTPSTGVTLTTLLSFHQGDDPAPTSLKDFIAIKPLSSDMSLRTSFRNFTDETYIAAFSDRSTRTIFMSAAVKAGPQTVSFLNTTFTEAIAASPALKTIPGYSLNLAFQLITPAWLQAARDTGGDAIDLDPADGPFITALIVSNWAEQADDAAAEKFATDTIGKINTEARERGLHYPFVYLNDGYSNQDPFSLYGKGKSLPKLRQIAKKYDPERIFQTLNSGGFKLG